MTDAEILEKAINKAIKNGWAPLEGVDMKVATFEFNEQVTRVIWRYKRVTALEEMSVYGVIFSHDFAESLWGEKWPPPKDIMNTTRTPRWYFHMQEMVVAPDPIEYLGQNLPN